MKKALVRKESGMTVTELVVVVFLIVGMIVASVPLYSALKTHFHPEANSPPASTDSDPGRDGGGKPGDVGDDEKGGDQQGEIGNGNPVELEDRPLETK